MKTTLAAASLALALAGGVPPVAAGAATSTATGTVTGTIVGGSNLLDAGKADQLGRWLGAGDIKLDNIYTLKQGDTSANFHRAADGKGANFVLLEVTNPAGSSYLVGGYDPQSWSSTDGWHETPLDSQRTGFLFNMTVPAVYRQVPSTYMLPSQGLRQTFNDAGLGPVFGAGPDLYVNGPMAGAISWQLTYGNPANDGKSIADGSTGPENLHLDALEVFAVSPVPEPLPAAMLLLGAGVLVLRARGREGRGR